MSDHGKVDAIGVNNTSEGSAFLELHFEDGLIVSHELARPYLEETAKLIRDYSKDKVAGGRVRGPLGLDPSKAEREFFEKFDGRLEEYLQRAFGPMLEMFKEMTEVTQQEDERFDAPEEAFPLSAGSVNEASKQIYMTIPQETPLNQVFAIVQTLETLGYPYTLNKE